MECPLFGPDKLPRKLQSIEANDFSQLADVEEGYAVEYKSTWDKDVKKKLPKIMTSFANADGGWLFVGIDDEGGYAGISDERADFDQTIAQIVHRHISPVPRFETRFVPCSDDKGVLVVNVFAGIEPPYLSDGSVFIRVGSSSEKYGPADSYALIDLHRRARQNLAEIKEFCRRTVYCPPSKLVSDVAVYDRPVVNVYLKRLHPQHPGAIAFKEIDAQVALFKHLFSAASLPGFCCQHSYQSLIFRPGITNCADKNDVAVELFYDGSIKLFCPLAIYQPPDDAAVIKQLSDVSPIRNTPVVKVIDGTESLARLGAAASATDGYFEAKGLSLSDFAYAMEFENVQGTFVHFKTEAYRGYVDANGFPYFAAMDGLFGPKFGAMEYGKPKRGDDVRCELLLRFMEACGLPWATSDEAVHETIQELLGFRQLAEEEQ